MTDILLKELAKDLNQTEDVLVKQFSDAGMKKNAADSVS